jgi:hypothetical protein
MRSSIDKLWLNPIPESLRDQARNAWEKGDWRSFLFYASHDDTLQLVFKNEMAFQRAGCYEPALVEAYTGGKTSQADFSSRLLELLFLRANRTRLLQVGSALPGEAPFTIYRGVAGSGKQRRVRGFSWSASKMVAAWFAWYFGKIFGNPALYTVTVSLNEVLFYTNERHEEEFVVMLAKKSMPQTIPLPEYDLIEQWHTNWIKECEGKRQGPAN